MFDNRHDDEVDFCEEYKSQILNGESKEEESTFGKIIIILLLLTAIVGFSIYGYNYYMKSIDESGSSVEAPPASIQTLSDDELVVEPFNEEDDLKVEELTVKETKIKSSEKSQEIVSKKEERVQKIEKTQKVEKVQKVEKTQTIEKTQKVEKRVEKPIKVIEVEKVTPSIVPKPTATPVVTRQRVEIEESELEKIANEVKLEIAKDETSIDRASSPTIKSNSTTTSTNKAESAYLEELAKLSKEVDNEK